MFSFGIEYERAFSTAFASARLPAGSGPPSRAATMIARESFEKSLPRFASAAPFLCLIDDHLLYPDMRLLLNELEEPLVHARVVRQLRVERRDEEAALPREHRIAAVLGEHLDLRPRVEHARRADEDPAERLVLAREVQVGLEARDLTPVGVPRHLEVDEVEVVPVEHDHPRARAEDRSGERAERLVEPVEAHEAHERRRLAARDDEAVEALELLRQAHLGHLGAEAAEHRRVLAEVALEGEDADARCHGLQSSSRPWETPRMAKFNVFTGKAPKDKTDPDGYHTGMARFGDRIGARLIGGSLYELPPGQSICPYHFEYGDEEWLIVLQGRPTLRRPRGTQRLAPGDVVCFPPGPDGAHKVTNRTEEPVRVLMVSTKNEPSVAVYPDSDKVGVWPGGTESLMLHRADGNVDYWEGEA